MALSAPPRPPLAAAGILEAVPVLAAARGVHGLRGAGVRGATQAPRLCAAAAALSALAAPVVARSSRRAIKARVAAAKEGRGGRLVVCAAEEGKAPERQALAGRGLAGPWQVDPDIGHYTPGERPGSQEEYKKRAEQTDDGVDRTDWADSLPKKADLEKWEDDEDGNSIKWILCKDGKMSRWKKESEVGVYRYTDGGYESRDESGNWVNYAQMPTDITHLTDSQRERLIKELRGEIKMSMSDGDDEGFRPMAEIPPLEKWPFYEVSLTEDLAITDEQLADYRELELSKDLGRAFFLAARWKQANEARRHLGYNVNDELEDVANMNGSVLALRCMVEQLKRTSRYRKKSAADRSEFSDSVRLDSLQVDVLLGTEKGSAIALWIFSEERKRIFVDIVIGDDCMDMGPYSEEMLIRWLARKAKTLGAEKLWCRTRRTESGRIFVPKWMKKLGFEKVPYDEQEEEEWQAISGITGGQKKEEVMEAIPMLNLWMSTRGLDRYMDRTNEWCKENGAVDINEVAENKEDLADFLELKGEERDRMMQY